MTTHFTGRVVLSPTAGDLGDGDAAAAGRPARSPHPTPSTACTSTAPPTRCWPASGETATQPSANWPPSLPANHAPDADSLVAAPRLVELCFQTAGVAELAADGSLGLPRRVRRLQVAPAAAEADAPAGPS